MARWQFLLAFLVICVSACSPRMIRIVDNKQVEQALKSISEYNGTIHQLRARATVRGHGLLGRMFREEADIVAQVPNFFILSLRSPLGPPMSVVAGNGSFLTSVNFSSGTEPHYAMQPITGAMEFEWFDMSLHPYMMVPFLLARVPLEGVKNIQLFTRNKVFVVSGKFDEFWHYEAIFNPNEHEIHAVKFINVALGEQFDVLYRKHERINGVSFPRLLIIHARAADSIKFQLELDEMELNGEPLAPESFFLKLH